MLLADRPGLRITKSGPLLTVIIPSHNEENHIQACLAAIIAQSDLPPDHGMQVIVAANGCEDRTVDFAQACGADLTAAGFGLLVQEIPKGSKTNALNAAEAAATHGNRVFIDADVIIGPRILRQLSDILAQAGPVYASGTVRVPRPKSLVSRAYAKVWTNLPFFRDGVPGIGLYAVNAEGRARWSTFPAIIADDRFVRLQFAPQERRKTAAAYDWPLPEGFQNLLNVRHRWKEGNLELAEKFPDLLANDSEINTTGRNALGLLRTPFSAVVFLLIYGISNWRARRSLGAKTTQWRRGRD